MPQLYLAYTYFLDVASMKYISIGFRTDTIAPSVIFRDTAKKQFLLLDSMDWMGIFMNYDNIKKFFGEYVNGGAAIKMVTLRKMLMDHSKNKAEKELIFKGEDGQIFTLNEKEFAKMEELADFVNSLIFFYKSTTGEVSQYVQQYFKRCLNKGVASLDSVDFFYPEREHTFNFSRLFYEMKIFGMY